jgi:hypothetical protein
VPARKRSGARAGRQFLLIADPTAKHQEKHMAASSGLPRRRFLQAGITFAAAGALGVGGTSVAAPARLSSPRDFGPLRGDMKGRLIEPGQEGYMMAAYPNNARWANDLPKAVAMCADESDVQRCINWVRDYRAPFAVRSGGHSYAGFSTTSGLLISVKAMNKVWLDPQNQEAIVQGGASNQDVANALNRTNLAIPSGRCPTVGTSGLVLGGGWGFSATRSGLTCDSLISTEVVLANATRATASKGNNANLFWALRGGGGGNFGVNTSFKFKLHEVSDVTIFNIVWPADKQIETLLKLQEIQQANARSISTRTKAYPNRAGAHPRMDELVVATLGVYWGNAKDAYEVLAPALGLKPLSADIRTMTYWQARDYLLTDDPTGMYDLRSSYVEKQMDERGLQTMLHWMTQWPGGSLLPENMGILFAVGGKVNDVKPADTAYVHRNANYIFEMECAWAPIDKPDVVSKQKKWLAGYFEAMKPFVLPQSYVNFPNRDLPNWARAYYGKNLEKLSEVKTEYDSANLFKFEQSIPKG